MKKIIYTGDVSPCRIKVGNIIFDKWFNGEIRDLDDVSADKILLNKNFSIATVEKSKKKEEKVIKEDVSFDD